MNKTTTLVLAAIAGFGLSAQARTTTNGLWTVNFEGVTTSQETGIAKLADLDASAMETAFTDGAWTVQSDDDSYVTNFVGSGAAEDKNRLELDTQGNDLTWTPTDTGLQGNRSITEMDVRFVAADDAPDGFDATTVQTAFFVQNIYTNGFGETQDDPQSLQLYAWTYDTDGETNHWEAIGAPFAASFADSMHHVQILIDYRDATYPYLHVAVDGTEVTGEGVVAANAGDTLTTGKMTAVTFKGTGTIDNFTGTRLFTDFAEYDFTAEVYMDGEYVAADSQVKHAYAGDYDDPTHKAVFDNLPTDDAPDPTYSLARVVIVDLSTGNETTYAYTYDEENWAIVPVSTACPVLDVDDGGIATLSPYTYGATNDSVIAKLYYNTLDAYYANEVVTVGSDSVTTSTFVKPADCPKTFTNVYPASTNVNETAYKLSSVQVRGGATVAFANDEATVSFSVDDQLSADTTYVEATYVAGNYIAAAVGWSFDSTTGIGTFTNNIFTVAFTWHDGSSSDTYTYGDTLTAPTIPETYVDGGATWTFTGWSSSVPATVTASATYEAQYEMTTAPKATVIMITDNGATTNLVGTYGSLAAAVDAAPSGATVVLNEDDAATRIIVEDDVTIDLGGHTYTGRLSMFDGNVVVTNGTVAGRFDVYDSSVVTLAANTTVDGYVIVWGDGVYGEAGCKTPTFNLYGTVRNNDPETTDEYAISTSSGDDSRPVVNIYEGAVVETIWAGVGIRNGASLNMTGGSITAGEFGIYNNGSDTTPTTIAVSGGTVTSTNEVNSACGIYQAGPGTLTISGTAVVRGPDAVEVRAGTVQVLDNARLVATMPYTEPASNGNGNSGHGGVALLVSQHTTAQNVSASVDGGTLQGPVAFEEATVETQNDETKVSGAINAGAILGDVLSEDIDDLIPSDSEALFADAGAEGVEEGYGLQEDPENPGLYKVVKTHVVTYANYDGTALQVTTNFVNDATPAYAGATPVKSSDSQYDYTFTGWSPQVAATVTEDATYVAQFSAKENGTVIVITDNGATTNYFATLQAALDDVKANNLQQANIELLADATITISKDGNVLGGNSTTNITINGNDHALHVVRDGTWAQFNTANGAKLVLSDMSLTSEFTGTQTGWVGDTLQNPNHNIAFNCDVELDDVTSTTALSFWKDADLDTVTIAETVDVYSIWIHTTASNIAIKDLVVNSPTGRGIKVDDSFVKYAGAPSASTAISIDGASFTTKNKKAAVLVRSAYPIAVTTSGTIDISNVPADTQHLVWVDEDASENFGLVTFNGAQSGLGVEGGASSYAASLTTNAWIAGYYKVLADAVEVATSADTVTLLKENAETFTVSKALTITRNGFSAANVTAGEGYQRTDTAAAYVFAVKPATVIVISANGATTNNYYTVSEAVAAAANGEKVVLLADVNEAVVNNNANAFTIDLNGHTWSSPSDVLATSAGTITIEATNGGTMTTEAAQCCAVWAKGGDVVINGGTFNSKDNEEATIYVSHANSVITINGGTFENKDERPYRWKSSLQALTLNVKNDLDGQHLVINGGTFIGNDPQLGDDTAGGTSAQSDVAFVSDGYVAIVDGEGNFVVQEGYNVTFDANGGSPTPDAQRVAKGGKATEPADPSKEGYTFDGWQLSGSDYDFDTVLSADITLVAAWTEESQEEGHIGAKSEEGFYILAPADDDYDETQPLTFEAPDLTAGTVGISASMVCPDGVDEVTLTLLYKTDLTASTYSRAQVTVTDIDPVAGTATVELPSGLGDTVFFFGFSNEAGVVDTTSEP